jgi:tubulin alpha
MFDGDITKTDRSLCGLFNASTIATKINELSYNFDLLFAKRAFVHWFAGDGVDDAEFME